MRQLSHAQVLTDNHRDALKNAITAAVFKEFSKEDSPLFQASLAKLMKQTPAEPAEDITKPQKTPNKRVRASSSAPIPKKMPKIKSGVASPPPKTTQELLKQLTTLEGGTDKDEAEESDDSEEK